MPTLSINNARASGLYDAIVNRQEFTTHGSLSGYPYDVTRHGEPQTGHLPDHLARLLCDHDTDYIVYSYNTPIAWHLASTDVWIVPDVKYSVTTSKQQGRVRFALHDKHVIETN